MVDRRPYSVVLMITCLSLGMDCELLEIKNPPLIILVDPLSRIVRNYSSMPSYIVPCKSVVGV
jgi:hypothetical protein